MSDLTSETTLHRLSAIRDELKDHTGNDPELWRGFDKITGMLRNLPDDQLAQRFRDIVTSLVWLRRPSMDIEPIDNGHYSTMWWLRMLAQTEAELERRDVAHVDVPEVPAADQLIADCVPTRDTQFRLWARVSGLERLLKTLTRGEIWFSPAESFDDPKLNAAQRDDEMRRRLSSPGQIVKIIGPDGSATTPIGDVTYTRQSPRYWLSSWSTGPDLRLIDEFGVDACLVVWNPSKFGDRIALAAERDHIGWHFAAFPIQYVDQYEMLTMDRLPVSMTKEFPFARQRELRLGLLPRGVSTLPTGGFLVAAGSIEDIAGVYDRQGKKVAGSGPDSLIAE